MDADEARVFADEWIAAWNARDLDRILSHYADEIVFLSPVAELVVEEGRVAGKDALRAYWTTALAAVPDLHFELTGVRVGYECLTILYRNQRGQDVAETVELGAGGLVVRSFACYFPPSA